ncbi:MAG: phosphoribosylaminoimidazole carboxylase ATPase subunit [Bacteroidetes bacterium OLB9]|nr:MAG: phosphoribosylaminoimidazole carboxylase ATPase subunit [Bacteroidetes bacterium OLB9]
MATDTIGKRIGILGGGQLGKMLCQAGSRLGLMLSVMDKDHTFPAYSVCPNFTMGDITSYEDVMAFGSNADILTIEIEKVNIEALEALEREGKEVYPRPSSLRIITDKGKQKIFYEGAGFPTSDFVLYKSKDEIINDVEQGTLKMPFVQKLRTEGYDGRGVHVVKTDDDMVALLEGASVVEDLIDVDKEFAVIVARSVSGEMAAYPVVEMQFHPMANLVEFLFSPSTIPSAKQIEASQLAIQLAEKLEMVGLLAVEMFLDKSGKIWINEVAPRPHNSGHHTIEACAISQYEMHLRALLDWPLGSTEQLRYAVMVNLLGAEGHNGAAEYQGLREIMAMSEVYLHIYGKKETKPFRKMGHVTITGSSLEEAIAKAHQVQNTLKVISS